MLTSRRWLQFSMRGLLVVMTAGCLWLGWKVEGARKRGQAIDALVLSGRPVKYLDAPYEELNPSPHVDHFQADLASARVWLFLDEPIDGTTAAQMAAIPGVGRVDVIGKHAEAELRYLEAVTDGCHIRFHDFTGLPIAALERLQRKLPNSAIDCPFFGRWVPLAEYIELMSQIESP